MAKLVVVSVFDKAAGAYGRPVFCASKGIAIRSFQDEVKRSSPDNDMQKHPEDFVLYELGTFDDAIGLFECDQPVHLLRGVDVA